MAIISTVFGSLLGIPFVTDILKGVAVLGYKNLKDKNKVYKFLAEKGIEKPTDDNKSLYIHSLILLNFQINDPNYLQVLISEDSFAVFESSVIQKRREEPFIIHVNQELLSILSHDDPDDVHRRMSEKIVKEFIKIYDGLVLQVATPVQNNILNSLDDINQGNTEIKAGIAMIISRLDDKEEDSPIVKSQISFINGFIETRKFELGVEGLRNLEKNLDQIKSLDLRSNILVNLGYCLHELGKKEEAKVYFKKAYEVNDMNFGALCNYSQALVDEGNYELGEELVQKAVGLYGDKLPQVWEAYILIKRRKISLEELIKDIPKHFIENANIQRVLGIVYRTLGIEDSYLYHIKKAYEIDPENADTRFSYIES
ncbi:MAG: tetratricopeptide repeat protein, partial [Sphingobacterium siyangense]